MRARHLVPASLVLGGLFTPSAGAAVRDADWAFGGISTSQRTLRISVTGGGCGETVLAPVALESAASVRITAPVFRDETAEPRPCPAILLFTTRFVSLQTPLAGRSILGARGAEFVGSRARTPRVVGLSPGDAITVLRRNGLRPKVVRRRTTSGLRRVTGQRSERLAIGGRR